MIGFRMPTHIHIEAGALARLPKSLQHFSSRRVLLVMDPGLGATEWPERAQAALTTAGFEWRVFDRVEPNPRTSTAEEAAEIARRESLGVVVGLGGGSVLDAAKAAAMLASNPGRATDFTGKNRFSTAPLPFVAIPTTCGTGSEVTWVSVLTDPTKRSKISLKGDLMFPNQALVDADLLRTLPPGLVAATGLDAFTHAIEATTCKLANPVSDLLAEGALRLLWTYLPRAVADIEADSEARFQVMRASTIAGMAFGNADVASVHCLSESLGGFLDVPHGLTNAILLVPALTYNRQYIDQRLAALHRLLIGGQEGATSEDLADDFLQQLSTFAQELGIPSFASLGVDPADYPTLAANAFANGSNASNARPMQTTDYLNLLKQAEKG
jgi:alcohol dehydrogenase